MGPDPRPSSYFNCPCPEARENFREQSGQLTHDSLDIQITTPLLPASAPSSPTPSTWVSQTQASLTTHVARRGDSSLNCEDFVTSTGLLKGGLKRDPEEGPRSSLGELLYPSLLSSRRAQGAERTQTALVQGHSGPGV